MLENIWMILALTFVLLEIINLLFHVYDIYDKWEKVDEIRCRIVMASIPIVLCFVIIILSIIMEMLAFIIISYIVCEILWVLYTIFLIFSFRDKRNIASSIQYENKDISDDIQCEEKNIINY